MDSSNSLRITGRFSWFNRFLLWAGGHPAVSWRDLFQLQSQPPIQNPIIGTLNVQNGIQQSFRLPRGEVWLSFQDPAGASWEILARKKDLSSLNLSSGDWQTLEKPPFWRAISRVFRVTWGYLPHSLTWQHYSLLLLGLIFFQDPTVAFLKWGGAFALPPALYGLQLFWIKNRGRSPLPGHYRFSLRLELTVLLLSTVSQTWLLSQPSFSLRLLFERTLELIS